MRKKEKGEEERERGREYIGRWGGQCTSADFRCPTRPQVGTRRQLAWGGSKSHVMVLDHFPEEANSLEHDSYGAFHLLVQRTALGRGSHLEAGPFCSSRRTMNLFDPASSAMASGAWLHLDCQCDQRNQTSSHRYVPDAPNAPNVIDHSP